MKSVTRWTAGMMLLLACMVATAQNNTKRIDIIGPTEKATCETAQKKALVGHESTPAAVTFGSCTCAPNKVTGSSGGFECVLYFTTK